MGRRLREHVGVDDELVDLAQRGLPRGLAVGDAVRLDRVLAGADGGGEAVGGLVDVLAENQLGCGHRLHQGFAAGAAAEVLRGRTPDPPDGASVRSGRPASSAQV